MWACNISAHFKKFIFFTILKMLRKKSQFKNFWIEIYVTTFSSKKRRQISFVRELIPFSKQLFTKERGKNRCGLWARALLKTIENHRCVLNVSGKCYRLTSPNIFVDFFIFRNFSKMLGENVASNRPFRSFQNKTIKTYEITKSSSK